MAEQFPESVVEKAWERSKEQCECTREYHPKHSSLSRCPHPLIKKYRGIKIQQFGWEPHLIDKEGLPYCEILCFDCYDLTIQSEKNFIKP